MTVTLTVPGKTLQLTVDRSATVENLLVTARQQGRITFAGRTFAGIGWFIEEIDGLRQDGLKGMYWVYSVNGKKANVGVSAYVLSPGDQVSFTYEPANT